MDGASHLVAGHGGIGGGHVGDQVRERDLRAALVMLPAVWAVPARFVSADGLGRLAWAAAAGRGIVAGLGHVQLAAQPELLPLDAPPGIEVIGGGDPQMAVRETVALRFFLPPLDHLPPVCGDDAGVVLHQHPAQHVHRRDLPQPARGGAVINRLQQRVPVPGVGDRQLIAPGLGSRRPPGGHRGGVAAGEIGHADPLGHPARVRGRQRLQRRAHALPGQLQPVQRRHRGDHVGGIGALPAARLHQALSCQASQQGVQRHLLQPGIGHPVPETSGSSDRNTRVPSLVEERVLGPEHPDILTTRGELARFTGEAGDAAAARVLLAEVLPVEERVLGPEHPFTLADRRELARWTERARRRR